MEVYHSESEQETLRIGKDLGKRIEPPLLILLYGELGAGKTVLARGLAEGLGMPDTSRVRSPSFTLVNEYPARCGTIYHLDLYRLENLRDLYSIDIEDILASHAVVIIEWAEKLKLAPPERTVSIRIFPGPGVSSRRIEVEDIDSALS